MKNHFKLIKALSWVAILALSLSACLFGGKPARTLSAQEVLQTAVYLTLTALVPVTTRSSNARTSLPTAMSAGPPGRKRNPADAGGLSPMTN